MLGRCTNEGALIVGEVVVAELAAILTEHRVAEVLDAGRIGFVPSDIAVAIEAGNRWTATRSSRERRVVADFLVGAHALEHADRLLTRDRGFYHKAFGGLTVIEPRA